MKLKLTCFSARRSSCSRSWIRFIVLLCLCIMGFCGMFVFDIPGSLQNSLISSYDLSEFQYSLFYSLYSWPSVVVCFFGGLLVDKYFGVKLATVLFAGIQIIGVSFTVVGAFTNGLWLMLIGRFIFGIGGEMSAVCVNILVLMWFKGHELNTVFAVIQNTLRLGTSAVYLVSTPLMSNLSKLSSSERESLSYTLLVLCGVTIFPLLLAVFVTLLSPQRGKNDNTNSDQDVHNKINDINVSDLRNLPVTFWILCISTNLYYHALFTFLAFTQQFFTKEFGESIEKANQVSSLFNIIPVALATLFGIIVDRLARNVLFIIAAVLTAIAAHVFAATLYSPYLII